MRKKVGLGFTFCAVHRFTGLIHGRSSLSRILGLLLVWEGTVLGHLISLPNQGWKMNRLLSPLNQVPKGLREAEEEQRVIEQENKEKMRRGREGMRGREDMMRGSGAGGLAGKAMGFAMHVGLQAQMVAAEVERKKLRRRAETAGITAAETAGRRAERLNVQGVSGGHGGNLYFNSGRFGHSNRHFSFNSGHRRDGSNFPGGGAGHQQLWARGGIGQQQQHGSWNRHNFFLNSGHRRDVSNFPGGGVVQQQLWAHGEIVQQQMQHNSWNRRQPQFAVHKQRFRPPLRQQHNHQNLPRHQQRSSYYRPQRFHPPSQHPHQRGEQKSGPGGPWDCGQNAAYFFFSFFLSSHL